MKMAIDSSAFAKRYVYESGSVRLDALLSLATTIGLSVLVFPEIISALQRRMREGYFSRDSYQEAKSQLLADLKDATILRLTPTVVARSVALLEENILRTLDALHVASAIQWEADLFVTADKRQAAAARKAGLEVEYLGNPADATP